MTPFAANPFTALTLIAAPAVLTNASSVMALGTSNRFARAIDRARALSQVLENRTGEDDPLTPMRIRQLDRTERRAILLLHALRLFCLSLGAFAAASLVSILGAAAATTAHHIILRVTLWLALLCGAVGVVGLVSGCLALVTETQLAVLNISEEANLLRERYKDYLLPEKETK